ncbi:MAG: outer membrane protein assembly factor BamB family protein [bacterium]
MNFENVEKKHVKLSVKVIILLTIVGIVFLVILTEIIVENKNNIKDYIKNPGNNAITSTPLLSDSGWLVYRGNSSLLGVARGKLPDKLELIWRFKTQGPVKSSPAIYKGRAYIGSNDGNVYAIDISNGQKVWTYKTGGYFESSPCIVNGYVYIGSSDSFLYAIDAENGSLKWKYGTDAKILGSPNYLLSPKKDKTWIVFGSYDNTLHCVDAETGKAIWKHETSNYINGAPAISDDKIAFGGCDAFIHVLTIDGKPALKIDTGSYIAGSPALLDKYLYIGNYEGKFISADINTGKILWTYENDGTPFFSSPAVNKAQIIVGSRDKNLYCFRRDNGKLIWKFPARDKIDSSPVIVDNKVIVGSDDGRLYMISLSNGKELWHYEIGEPIISSPAVASGMVIIGSDDGYVYAFGKKS